MYNLWPEAEEIFYTVNHGHHSHDSGAIGGGVNGVIVAHNRNKNAAPTVTTAIQAKCGNTGLAAMLLTNLNDTLHKRLYCQNNED